MFRFLINLVSARKCHHCLETEKPNFSLGVWEYLSGQHSTLFSLRQDFMLLSQFIMRSRLCFSDLLNLFQSANQHVDLNFRAINYSAEVYLNGHKEILPKGMFRRHSIDVTSILHLDVPNLLAVLVHPPDHPGRIPPEGGQGGDHEV